MFWGVVNGLTASRFLLGINTTGGLGDPFVLLLIGKVGQSARNLSLRHPHAYFSAVSKKVSDRH